MQTNEPYYKEVLEQYPIPGVNEMRLKDRVAIVVGAGQSPGEGIGNGRATALTFAREGAKVLCVDHHLESAQETADMIAAKGGTATAFKAADGDSTPFTRGNVFNGLRHGAGFL